MAYMYVYIYVVHIFTIRDFPGGLDSNESACNAGDLASISGLGRSLGEGKGYPLQYSCLENSKYPGRLQSMWSQRVRHD